MQLSWFIVNIPAVPRCVFLSHVARMDMVPIFQRLYGQVILLGPYL